MSARRETAIRRLQLDLVAAYATRLVLSAFSTVFGLLPQRRKVTMLTREHPRPPLDFLLLADAIRRLDASVEIVMLARMVPRGVLPKVGFAFRMVAQLWHIATSTVLIVDGYSIPASAARHRAGLTIVQMWHALGALKKFGLSIVGLPEGRDPRIAKAMRMHRNYDLVLASAEACRAPFAEAFGADIDKVAVAPLPRVDRLRDPEARQAARQRFEKLYPELREERILLYAPTFRMNGATPVALVDLSEALGAAGFSVITKLHPIVAPPTHPRLRTAPGMSTQELLLVADVFVTDYSSAVFEAAVAGVPSYLFAPDLDHYLRSRDFYIAYPDDLGLPLSQSIEELATSVRSGLAMPAQLDALVARFVAAPEGGSLTAAADGIARLLAKRTSGFQG